MRVWFVLFFVLLLNTAAYGADSPALLKEVRSLVRENFVRQVDENLLQQDTAEGIIAALGDSHSEYLSAEELEDLMDSTRGAYAGVGMELSLQPYGNTAYPMVVSIFAGSPASKGGIVPGDRIIEVNGMDTGGKNIAYIVSLIKGTPGTKVTLTVARDSSPTPLSVRLTREIIQVQVVTYERLENNLGYISMSVFSAASGQEVRSAVKALMSQGCKGIILDLRNNPGGYLDAGLETAEIFVPSGKPIMHIRNRQGTTIIESSGDPISVPLVVLVNSESASAAEIVAGAIKDYRVGTLVGTTTYGKGTVQSVQQLETAPDAAVKLTIAEYLSPKGTKIDGIGVTPDYYIEGSEKQLETGKEVLLKLVQGTETNGSTTLLLDPKHGTAYLNGLKVAGNASPFLDKNVVMVPLRLMSSFLDGKLYWNDQAQTATLEYGPTSAVISVGKQVVSTGSEKVTLSVAPKLIKGRIFVPLRLLSSFDGISVDWDPVLDCAEVNRNK